MSVNDDPLLWLFRLRAKNRGLRTTAVSADELEVVGATSGTPWTVRLDTLRRRSEQTPRDEWRAMVDEFLDQLGEADDEPVDLDDLDSVRPNLRTRLYPVDREIPDGTGPVSRVVAPGIEECLVVDQPNTVLTFSAERTAGWPLGADELLELGRANLRRGRPLEVTRDVVQGAEIATLSGDDDYASAHLLWLDRYPVLGPYGALVSVPMEGVLYAHPLTDGTVYAAGGVLAGATLERFHESPKKIAGDLYHWHDGVLELAAVLRSSDDETQIVVTGEFQELMEHLAAR